MDQINSVFQVEKVISRRHLLQIDECFLQVDYLTMKGNLRSEDDKKT